MSKQRVQRNFRPWPENQERLEFAEKIGLNDDGFVDPQYRVAVVSQFVPPRVVFMAVGNDKTNYISLRGRTRWRSADKLPSALFFDLEK